MSTFLGVVFAELCTRTFKDNLNKPVLQKIDANCIDVLPTITKQFSNRKHHVTKLAPIHASFKKVKDMITET